MSGLTAAVWAEALKARRSRVPLVTAIAISLAPLMGSLFMVILKDPAMARRFGLISTKAQLSGVSADWTAYLGLLTQAIAVGGLVVFGMVAIWLFGREYSDRTIKDLLALPTSRATIVIAKMIVFAVWSALLAALVFGLGLALGASIGLPGWSAALALHSAIEIAIIAGLTLALAAPFALAASVGRGYLPPVGALFLTIFLSQVIAALGWGAYFPWSVPALLSGVAGPGENDLGSVSYLLVLLSGFAGLVGALAWWRTADQS